MPRESYDKEEPLTETQKKPHLAVLGIGNKLLAVPPGAVLCHVEDASQEDGVFPWRLVSVQRRKWEFKCPCGREGCTRTMTATLKYAGQHTGPNVVTK